MEYGSIVREIRIDAAPKVVFDVVSDPEHVQQWWPDEAVYEPVPGGTGRLSFVTGVEERKSYGIQVVDAEPYRLFSFRWTQPEGDVAREDNSFLVTFELTPAGSGTLLRMTEIGFREQGWEAAVLEEAYRDHCHGWDHFLPRIAPYVATLRTASR